jgi:hypothetical protein
VRPELEYNVVPFACWRAQEIFAAIANQQGKGRKKFLQYRSKVVALHFRFFPKNPPGTTTTPRAIHQKDVKVSSRFLLSPLFNVNEMPFTEKKRKEISRT